MEPDDQIERIHAFREAYAAGFGYDLAAIVADQRKRADARLRGHGCVPEPSVEESLTPSGQAAGATRVEHPDVLAEIRATRDAYAERFTDDLEAMAADLRLQTEEPRKAGWRIVSFAEESQPRGNERPATPAIPK